MIKLFVTDLDDTLVYKVNRIETEDARALSWLAEKGTHICFASGRFAHRIHEVVNRFSFPYYTAGLNGAVLLSCNNEMLHESTFQHEVAREIYEYMHEKQLADIVCAKEKRYTKKKNDYHRSFEEDMSVTIREVDTLEEEFGKTIHPSKLFLYGEEGRIIELDKELRGKFQGKAEVVISGKGYVDVMPVGISKGNALRLLMDHLQLEPHEVACIGDSFNDVSMFEVTPHSFTLRHAHPYIKERAAHVVRSVEEAIMRLPLLA